MLNRAVRIARPRGIELRADASVLVLAALVAWVFTQWFTDEFALPMAIGMAIVGAVLVLLTTLAHELAHALEARHRGLEVTGITLFLFGGVTEMHAHGQSARDELAIAAVGPYVSLVCGALFGIVATFAGDWFPTAIAAPVARVAGLLGWWNVLLAAFNLVPGAPLDGGRVLRAVLWMALGDRLRALRWSVRAGQALAVLLLVAAAWVLTRAPGAWLPALAFGLVAVFLWRAASAELRQAIMADRLEGVTVGRLLGTLPPPDEGAAPAGLPTVRVDDDLHTLVERFQGATDRVTVLDHEDRPLGIITEPEAARALYALRTGQLDPDGSGPSVADPVGSSGS
ncbi:MAG: site-2 protease family protein [Nitriliruptoraceae bacterium]|nr:site-2 protease family protein [Nitriliruptoraceae bacterium]